MYNFDKVIDRSGSDDLKHGALLPRNQSLFLLQRYDLFLAHFQYQPQNWYELEGLPAQSWLKLLPRKATSFFSSS